MSLADIPGVNRLHRDVWWPERSELGWKWLMNNPATLAAKAPVGFVLDNDQGQPGAFLGNFSQRFWQGDTPYYATTGFSVIVPRTLRGATRKLIPTFLEVPDHVAHYTLNCNELSSPIYKRFGLDPWPPTTHDIKLAWIVRPLTCAISRGLRTWVERHPETAHRLGERLVPRRTILQANVLGSDLRLVTDLEEDGAYDLYWQSLRAEGRFMADRSPEMLKWRQADPDLTYPIMMIAAWQDDRIVGHAMAMMVKYSPIEPATLEILDVDALADSRDQISKLISGFLRLAPGLGAAKMRLQVVSQPLLDDLGDLAQRARREGGYGHCHFRMAPGFTGHHTWQPTPFDGDFSLCWRPLPMKRPQPGSA